MRVAHDVAGFESVDGDFTSTCLALTFERLCSSKQLKSTRNRHQPSATGTGSSCLRYSTVYENCRYCSKSKYLATITAPECICYSLGNPLACVMAARGGVVTKMSQTYIYSEINLFSK